MARVGRRSSDAPERLRTHGSHDCRDILGGRRGGAGVDRANGADRPRHTERPHVRAGCKPAAGPGWRDGRAFHRRRGPGAWIPQPSRPYGREVSARSLPGRQGAHLQDRRPRSLSAGRRSGVPRTPRRTGESSGLSGGVGRNRIGAATDRRGARGRREGGPGPARPNAARRIRGYRGAARPDRPRAAPSAGADHSGSHGALQLRTARRPAKNPERQAGRGRPPRAGIGAPGPPGPVPGPPLADGGGPREDLDEGPVSRPGRRSGRLLRTRRALPARDASHFPSSRRISGGGPPARVVRIPDHRRAGFGCRTKTGRRRSAGRSREASHCRGRTRTARRGCGFGAAVVCAAAALVFGQAGPGAGRLQHLAGLPHGGVSGRGGVRAGSGRDSGSSRGVAQCLRAGRRQPGSGRGPASNVVAVGVGSRRPGGRRRDARGSACRAGGSAEALRSRRVGRCCGRRCCVLPNGNMSCS